MVRKNVEALGDLMKASVGDHIIIKGHRVGAPDASGEVLEVRGAVGGAPYVVRWREDDHESLFFPGSDAMVQHVAHAPTAPGK